METRCPRWYQINVLALGLRELRNATGGGLGFWAALPVHLLGRIFRRQWLAPDLIPEDITVIEQPEAPLDVPPSLAGLGFRPLLVLSLPEFSGRNLIHMLADGPRETICEILMAWTDAGETTWQGANVVLASAFEDGQLLRTISSPGSYPTLPPPGHHVVLVRGGEPSDLYERHREKLRQIAAEAGTRPQALDAEACIDVALRSHRELVAFQRERGVFVEAAPELVDALLREHGLSTAAESGRRSVAASGEE